MSSTPGRVPPGPRDPFEAHRAATPLELLFDLVTVIAIASAAAGLHHAIAQDHLAHGIFAYLVTFFVIWWGWMNFTWYASAYDSDSTGWRLLTFMIMAGALVVAAGVPALFERLDLRLSILGYVLMRVAMVAFWLRAARNDPEHSRTAYAYAIGIAVLQAYWVLALLVFRPAEEVPVVILLVLGIGMEMAVPAIAERHGMTPWHRHHMIERYGLLNIIVLGEILLAGAMALQLGMEQPAATLALAELAACGLVITFAMWWLYFSREDHIEAQTLTRAFAWGYGHIVVYAAGAAVGAGFAVCVEVATGHALISQRTATLAVAIPLAAYMAGLWFVRDRAVLVGAGRHVLLPFALAVVASGWLAPGAVWLLAAIAVGSVLVRSRCSCVSEIRGEAGLRLVE